MLKSVNFSFFQMQVLHVMSYVIERVGVEIRPFAGALMQYLPSLWQESEEHNMLRCAILTTLTNLVQVNNPFIYTRYARRHAWWHHACNDYDMMSVS